jgi:hypothetical protein
MLQPRLLIRSGMAVSVITHLAVLTVGLGYAGVQPFETTPTEAILVDIVSPEEVKEATKEVPVTPPLDIPDLSAKDRPAPPPAQPPSAAQQQASQQPAPPAPSPNPKSTARQAALQPQPAASQPAAPQPAAAQPPPPQPASPWLPNLAGAAQPDLSVKYQVNLGLSPPPNSDFDAPAMSAAKVATSDIARFRERLKACSTLPASIAPTDKVTIMLRATFLTDGTLARPPLLIEASASAKGPLLMQAAIKALQKCQPYAVLPADKYDEWKVLDLSFTPRDFKGG